VSSRKFWLPLSVGQHIDRYVLALREFTALKSLKISAPSIDHGELPFSKDEVYFKDLMFFAVKGIKLHYLKDIFVVLKEGGSLEESSVCFGNKVVAGEQVGRNDYDIAGEKKLYPHIIDAAKRVYSLKGYTDKQLNDGALLVLFHDIGKMSKYLCGELGIPFQSSHEELGAVYAEQVMTEQEDAELLETFVDYLTESKKNRKFQQNISGKICTLVDIKDRKENKVKRIRETIKEQS
jgi:hypothetical protein